MKFFHFFKNNFFKITTSLLVIFFLLVSVYSVKAFAAQPVSISTPTILVPGTSAGKNRFDDFIQEITVATGKSSSVLKVVVNTDGTFDFSGSLNESSDLSFIVVAFEDNSEEAVDKQGDWFRSALVELAKRYSFTDYNFIGHSNGGLVVTTYLENYAQDSDPVMKKLITLGTPYNDTSAEYNNLEVSTTSSVKEVSPLLESMIEKNDELPSALEMLVIAGDESDEEDSDGTVPVESVLAASEIYQENIASYNAQVLTGEDTSHSDLTENQDFIQLVANFFYTTAQC